jgi:hypothetical protein
MRRIVTVGFQLASDDADLERITSSSSLLDWDIILFYPFFQALYSYSDTYQGKPSLNDNDSFRLKERCEHWRREIKQAFDAGKTVVVFLSALKEIYVATGTKEFSGTGRNSRVTRHVDLFNNYKSLPVNLSPTPAEGNLMTLNQRGSNVLASYWAEFGSLSKYRVQLTDPKVPSCILTRSGKVAVGALYNNATSSGSLLCLPDIDFEAERFFEREGNASVWTSEAKIFAAKLIAAVVSIDKALREKGELTPEPSWAKQTQYEIGTEIDLRAQLLDAEQNVEVAQKKKEDLADQLKSAGAFRALLYEKGKPLENVLIQALRLLGFDAKAFENSESEFDVVFESTEGRLIGEVEGKDGKAINIEKLRQLSMNIHEDLQRESVSIPAKPVLFGNGFRLLPMSERADPFTEKCHSAAKSSNTALVSTPDLFPIVQFLLSRFDAAFAQLCRQTLVSSVGRVVLPPIPIELTAEMAG